MVEILDYIKKRFPEEWLSNLVEDVGHCGVDIRHPKTKEKHLIVEIFLR